MKKVNSTTLSYDDLSGAQGHLHCLSCSFITIVNINWFKWNLKEGKPGIKTSYQCLDCGIFTNVDLINGDKVPKCHCGGSLSNKHQLFCSICKSNSLKYTAHFFT